MHYVQDTALLISKIDGSINGTTASLDAFDLVCWVLFDPITKAAYDTALEAHL